MTSTLDIAPLVGRGYCCSQVMVMLALEAQGRENPELVRAMFGLCRGLASTGGTCGILTGGCLVLGLYAGRGREEELAHERQDLIITEFVDWFRERATNDYGDITCQAILSEGKPDASRCGGLMADAWDQILTILTEAGIDPSEPRE